MFVWNIFGDGDCKTEYSRAATATVRGQLVAFTMATHRTPRQSCQDGFVHATNINIILSEGGKQLNRSPPPPSSSSISLVYSCSRSPSPPSLPLDCPDPEKGVACVGKRWRNGSSSCSSDGRPAGPNHTSFKQMVQSSLGWRSWYVVQSFIGTDTAAWLPRVVTSRMHHHYHHHHHAPTSFIPSCLLANASYHAPTSFIREDWILYSRFLSDGVLLNVCLFHLHDVTLQAS